MKTKLPTKLPHLNSALLLRGYPDTSTGMCFHRTVAFVLDVPAAKLFIGTLKGATAEELLQNPRNSPVRFIHCWAQIGSQVYAPTTIEAQGGRLKPFTEIHYYQNNDVRDVKVMSRHTLIQLSKKYGLAEHLLYHQPIRNEAKFGYIILDALRVSHTLSTDGGLIPLE